MVDISTEGINIFTWEGYHAIYCRYYGKGFNGLKSWELTEEMYKSKTDGIARYASYESFKSTRTIKSKKKKVKNNNNLVK